MHLQLMELRRDIASVSETVRTGRLPTTRFEAATSAYSAWRQPRVSILTPLYNHADHVSAALDSVLTNRFRDLEIVIVNDGSTDDSLVAVKRWMAKHDDVSAAVISHTVNRGLPRARNTCLDFARGELSLVLDADNELLPHCLGRLLNAIEHRPQAAFAYGILKAFDLGGPSHLISQFEWDPPRLRRENYIDALALIRTAALRGIAGFATDRRLYGVEDWDLWATMADAGHSGVFVREIVGRYRVSATSMLSITNISPTAMYAAMVERHPELMSGVEPPL
jgi:glycosyltransferase involved in cell wall biosynthesis